MNAQPIEVIPGNPLTPDLIKEIIDIYTDSEGAAEVIRAINAVPPGTSTTLTTTVELSGFGFWLAIGAAAVAWILTHSA